MRAKTDKFQGRAKQIEGKLTGDRVRMAQGTVQRAKGDFESVVARVAREVKGDFRRVKSGVRRAMRKR